MKPFIIKNGTIFSIEANQPIKKYCNKEKTLIQKFVDFIYFPIRALLPYKWVQMLHLTDLGRERRMAVIPYLKGLILDVGCGPINQLKQEYSGRTITCDIYNWGNLDVVCASEALVFQNQTFDSVVMLACLNHFKNISKALEEAHRVLKPDGRLIITMPSKFIGTIVHLAVSWFDYDHVRGMDQNEVFGLSKQTVKRYLEKGGFDLILEKGFIYNLNKLFIAKKNEHR
ncbi:Methyltransferase type 11 domain protein [Candidatus Magnetomoraceae bacterium gMMP-15]